MNKIYLIILTNIIFGISIILCNNCIRPEICVPIDHCSTINQKLYQKNLNDNEILELRKLQCGFIKNVVYVCCKSSLPKTDQCGDIYIDTKVTKGLQTKLGQFPYIVLLGRRWRDGNKTGISYECGGSIISDHYILTAAHCVQFLDADYKQRTKAIEVIKLGEWNTATDPDEESALKAPPVKIAKVDKIIPHKYYRVFKKYNDIALIRLQDKIEYNEFVSPVCLPQPEQNLSNSLIVVGWGKEYSFTRELVEIQRFANLDFVPNDECNRIYQPTEIKSTQLCAGSQGSDSCNGDSGGPLLGIDLSETAKVYMYITGIVSFGRNSSCGTVGVPGVYTDVRKYINWIERNIVH